MDDVETPNVSAGARTAADEILSRLKQAGVCYLFANAGTDFASIVESLAASTGKDAPTIEALLVPHENVAVAMAHGYTMVTGEPQAVMVHVCVGTANALCGLMNASRLQIPMLLMAGRTPITEYRTPEDGARTRFVHWAQEMFDQAAMVREFVKWDYELRAPDEVDTVIDRALNLAQSSPQGPVYLTLPREVLGVEATPRRQPPTRVAASAPYPDPAAVARAADILLGAENPLIITADTDRDPAAMRHLGQLADRFAIPVIANIPRYLCLPSDHPMLLDYLVTPHLEGADAILVLDCDVPWVPSREHVSASARVIHMAPDPLYSRYPVRGYPCDVAITADSVVALPALAEAMGGGFAAMADKIEARRQRVTAARETVRAQWRKAENGMETATPIKPAWLGRCVSEIIDNNAILVNEMGVPLPHTSLKTPGGFFAASPISGLGWGLGAALGAKLAAPDKLVIAAVGDGSYYFGTPTAAHYCARAYDLPILIIVIDNSAWGAVRRATREMYPNGQAVRMNTMPLTGLEPMVDFTRVVEACGGYGERVEDPADLPDALSRAVRAVTVEKRQALLHVVCAAP